MPTQAKIAEALDGHRTKAELAARAAAEENILPDRGRKATLKPPKLMTDPAAKRYWREILKRMDGLEILDDLDAEMLGVYCSMLARIQQLNKLAAAFARRVAEDAEYQDAADQFADVSRQAQAVERNALSYAEKLGLTPSGRARLTTKRAQAAAETDPDADLFGD